MHEGSGSNKSISEGFMLWRYARFMLQACRPVTKVRLGAIF